MKALGGPAMLLVMIGGYAIFRGASSEVVPPREFTELELASRDSGSDGTCYALSTVLVANRVSGNSTRSWTAPEKHNKDKWILTLENVRQGYNGPQHEFQKFTFARVGEQVRLVSVEASEGLPTDVAANIDRLLEAPHELKSTPVDRCLKEHGAGYAYPPK